MAEDNSTDDTDPPVRRNVRTREFRYLYGELPVRIRALGLKTYELFLQNPQHPSLGLHALKNNSRGSHTDDSFAVSITMRYRAIFFADGNVNVWYWVGTHADYDRFTGG